MSEQMTPLRRRMLDDMALRNMSRLALPAVACDRVGELQRRAVVASRAWQ